MSEATLETCDDCGAECYMIVPCPDCGDLLCCLCDSPGDESDAAVKRRWCGLCDARDTVAEAEEIMFGVE